uniref:Uncharacterized protein n=1 Tax=Panagrolaimus davidi TaxID=227884 RepID=A0A914PQ07_9BILA
MSEINANTTDNGNNGADKKPVETKQEASLSRSSSETLKRPAEPEYVLVKDLSGELMELPTVETDNTLGLATLTHGFIF